MPTRFTIGEGDTAKDLTVRLKDRRGYIDLTSAVVTMTIAPLFDPDNPVIIDAPCAPFADQTDATRNGDRGKLRHTWDSSEVTTDKLNRTQRNYQATFTVTKDGRPETFPKSPSQPYIEIVVT